MKLNRNRIYSICVILFACVLLYMTSRLDSLFALSGRDVGPKFFPHAAAVGMMICAVGKFITEGKDEQPVFTKTGWKRIIMIFLILAVYLILMQVVGYLIATPIVAALLVIAMHEDRKICAWKVAAFSIVLTLALYVVFEKIILVFLPKGILFR